MGIRIQGKDPETRIRESLSKLEATIAAAGVGTIEIREQQAHRLVVDIKDILGELETAQECGMVSEAEAADLRCELTSVKRQCASLKGQNTKLKKRVEKIK